MTGWLTHTVSLPWWQLFAGIVAACLLSDAIRVVMKRWRG